MKKTILAALLLLTLTSCDIFNFARVCNQSGNDIYLIGYFDSDYITSERRDLDINDLVKTYHRNNQNLELVDYDTVRYVAKYRIRRDSCAEVESGRGRKPYFLFFRKLIVVNDKDTLVMKDKSEMTEAFQKKETDSTVTFDLEIK